jgi:hypothetical protein
VEEQIQMGQDSSDHFAAETRVAPQNEAEKSKFTPSVDLLAASHRSDTFPQDWSNDQRQRSLGRYEKWLRLKQLHPRSPLAPTRDIDLFWHLHMLAPVAYYRDCKRLFGRLIDHDGGFGKGEGELPILQAVFERTAAWWEQEYGEPYREDGKWMKDAVFTDCWHDCQDRCWHACDERAPAGT